MGAVPATTHAALPVESGTSHVSASVHPHWGTTPHLLLGAARTQVSGPASASIMPASLPVVTGPDCGVFGGAAFCSGISAGALAAAGTSSVNGARLDALEQAPSRAMPIAAMGATTARDPTDWTERWCIGNAIY